MSTRRDYEEGELCPPYITEIIWRWLKEHPPKHGGGGGNGDGWPIIKNALVSLQIYVMSSGIQNQQAAKQIREIAKQDLGEVANQLQ
jgi:hypothetical protein